MNLYNRTKCPDELMRRIMQYAARSVKCKSAGVAVQVNQGRWFDGCSGGAFNDKFTLWSRGKKLSSKYKRCNGALRVTLPKRYEGKGVERETTRRTAIQFIRICQHEWAHVHQYHMNNMPHTPRYKNGRRIPWLQRPCERAAESAAYKPWDRANKTRDSLVDKLADFLDGRTSIKEAKKKPKPKRMSAMEKRWRTRARERAKRLGVGLSREGRYVKAVPPFGKMFSNFGCAIYYLSWENAGHGLKGIGLKDLPREVTSEAHER